MRTILFWLLILCTGIVHANNAFVDDASFYLYTPIDQNVTCDTNTPVSLIRETTFIELREQQDETVDAFPKLIGFALEALLIDGRTITVQYDKVAVSNEQQLKIQQILFEKLIRAIQNQQEVIQLRAIPQQKPSHHKPPSYFLYVATHSREQYV